jgi:hypothetical protein
MKSKIAIETQVLLLKFSFRSIFRDCHWNTKNFIALVVCLEVRDFSGG